MSIINQSVNYDLRRVVLLIWFISLFFVLFLFMSGAVIALVLVVALFSREVVASTHSEWTNVLTVLDGVIIPMILLFIYHIVMLLA